MKARLTESAKCAAEEGSACDEARGRIGCGEDRVEDCGEVDAVQWGSRRRDDD